MCNLAFIILNVKHPWKPKPFTEKQRKTKQYIWIYNASLKGLELNNVHKTFCNTKTVLWKWKTNDELRRKRITLLKPYLRDLDQLGCHESFGENITNYTPNGRWWRCVTSYGFSTPPSRRELQISVLFPPCSVLRLSIHIL